MYRKCLNKNGRPVTQPYAPSFQWLCSIYKSLDRQKSKLPEPSPVVAPVCFIPSPGFSFTRLERTISEQSPNNHGKETLHGQVLELTDPLLLLEKTDFQEHFSHWRDCCQCVPAVMPFIFAFIYTVDANCFCANGPKLWIWKSQAQETHFPQVWSLHFMFQPVLKW